MQCKTLLSIFSNCYIIISFQFIDELLQLLFNLEMYRKFIWLYDVTNFRVYTRKIIITTKTTNSRLYLQLTWNPTFVLYIVFFFRIYTTHKSWSRLKFKSFNNNNKIIELIYLHLPFFLENKTKANE